MKHGFGGDYLVRRNEAHIGMRVVANRSNLNDGLVVELGEPGTICDLGLASIGVAWDKKHRKGHSCGGHCRSGYGWYVYQDYLDALPNVELQDIEIPDDSASLI